MFCFLVGDNTTIRNETPGHITCSSFQGFPILRILWIQWLNVSITLPWNIAFKYKSQSLDTIRVHWICKIILHLYFIIYWFQTFDLHFYLHNLVPILKINTIIGNFFFYSRYSEVINLWYNAPYQFFQLFEFIHKKKSNKEGMY